MIPALLPSLSGVSALLPGAASGVSGVLPGTFAQMLSQGPAGEGGPAAMLSEFASRKGVNDPRAPLNRAGLPTHVTDGEVTVHVRRASPLHAEQFVNEEHRVRVQWPDEGSGTTLQDVSAALNRIPGLKASIADDGRLIVMATDKAVQFRFGDDSSGLLAALGEDKTPLRQAFDQFVGNSLFGQMLTSMRKSQGKPAYLHGGRTEEIFQGQLDQELVKRLTSAQGGQLAETMYQQQFNQLRR